MPSIHDTELLESAKFGRVDKMGTAISLGANINAVDKKGNTALHWAVCKENIEAIQILLNHEADITLKNNDGHTPLIRAFFQPNPSILKLLLDHFKIIPLDEISLTKEFICLSRALRQGYMAGQVHTLSYQHLLFRMQEIKHLFYPNYLQTALPLHSNWQLKLNS